MDRFIPKLEFRIDQKRDIEEILQFVKEGDQYILDFFPQLRNVSEDNLQEMVEKTVIDAHKQHDREIRSKLDFLESKQSLLNEAMRRMSEICEEDWIGIESVSVVLSVNPIAPRNLQEKYFLLPVYESNETLLGFCAHELLHFIYFKKWSSTYNDSIETYEYPHLTWVLSEILAPIILSDDSLQKIIPSPIKLYPHWEEFDARYGIIEIFKKLFNERTDFSDFLRRSLVEYKKLDSELGLTNLLTE